MRNPHVLSRFARSRAVSLAFAVLLLVTGVPVSDVATARRAGDEPPVDLAAMVLRPSDFEAEGTELMGETHIHRAEGRWNYLPTGRMTFPEAVEESAVASMPDHLVGQLFLDLAETGWRQQFRSVLTGADDSPVFVSTVAEYADEDGAGAAFDLLTNIDDVPGVRELDDIADIVDESAAHRDTSSLLTVDGSRITVMFRIGNFIGTIRVYEIDPVDHDLLEALAERTVERIEQVLDGELGGLSHLVLRLDIAVSPFIERYDLLDDDFLPFWDESEDERDERAEGWEDRTDSYRLDQAIPLDSRELQEVPRYAVIIIRFEDEDAAADFLAGVLDQRETRPLDDGAEFGDESLTFAEEFDWLGVTRVGFRIFARVGDSVVNMTIDAPDAGPDLDILEELMDLQLECLDAGACPAQPIPSGLLDLTCATGPVEAADESLGYDIAGQVPMAGGDAAQTGEQPGPGLEGDPELLWRFEGAGVISVAPVVAEGLVVVGGGNGGLTNGGDGNLYALDAASGERGWCIPTGGSFPGSSAFADGLLIGAVNDPRVQLGAGSTIVALDPETGEEQWRIYTGGRAGDLLIDEETVFVPATGSLTALDLETGETVWTHTPDDEDAAITGLAVADGMVYFTTFSGLEQPYRIVALDARSGNEVWVREDSNDLEESTFYSGGPVVADGLVFAGNSFGGFLAIDAETGETVWSFVPSIESWEGAEHDGMNFNTPAVVDGVVYIGTGSDNDGVDDDGYLFALDAGTGEELWRYETGDAVIMQPAIVDDVAWFGDTSGLLHAVDTESGEELWTFELDGALGSDSPVIVDGVLFIAHPDGSLYALAGEDRSFDHVD
jgi:outer membrane protein assembly factor BamB